MTPGKTPVHDEDFRVENRGQREESIDLLNLLVEKETDTITIFLKYLLRKTAAMRIEVDDLRGLEKERYWSKILHIS